MRRPSHRYAILALGSVLAGCNTLPAPPSIKADDVRKAGIAAIDDRASALPPVQVVRVPAEALEIRLARDLLPPALANTPITVEFPGGPGSTLNDLVSALGSKRIQIVYRWDDPKNESLAERHLPFGRYDGTLDGLMRTLRSGMGLAYWFENGSIFISDSDRYAITLPQNKDVIESVGKELKDLGAKDIVTSLRGGKILYSASPRVQDESIGPYLARLIRNLSMITLQVAVVSVSVTDNSAAGFDWSKFSAGLDSSRSAIATLKTPIAGGASGTAGAASSTGTSTGGSVGGILTGIGGNAVSNTGSSIGTGSSSSGSGSGSSTGTSGTSTTGTTGTGTVASALTPVLGTVADLTGTGLQYGQTNLGKMFGATTALSVAGAIQFLSEFGKTDVGQNVELHTLSGADVKLRSGQNVPYVTGVGVSGTGNNNYSSNSNSSNNNNNNNNSGNSNSNSGSDSFTSNNGSNGNSNLLGSSNTSSVDTGLTLKMQPIYDADTQTVTVDIELNVKSIVAFVNLSAGNQIGSLSQPETQEQSLTDIVRLSAGQTVVIGGLQYDSDQRNGNDPAFLRQDGSTTARTGLNSMNVSRNALFVIMRPSITVFAPTASMTSQGVPDAPVPAGPAPAAPSQSAARPASHGGKR